MRSYFVVDESSCPTIEGKQLRNWPRHEDSKKTPSLFGWKILIVVALLLLIPAAAVSKGGNGNGGGDPIVVIDPIVDYGDVFGDLMHILRYEQYDEGLDEYVPTGQPIFAQRWIEMPAELPGYGWGYCAIGIDEFDAEISFLPYSCDLDVGDDPELSPVVEVDYFGRLNASRVQERNMRMHFNETITNIKQAGQLRLDSTGRLELGYESELNTGEPLCFVGGSPLQCIWSTIDSPMENLALYRRMIKYGHLSTDPLEEDLWWHGFLRLILSKWCTPHLTQLTLPSSMPPDWVACCRQCTGTAMMEPIPGRRAKKRLSIIPWVMIFCTGIVRSKRLVHRPQII